MSETSKQPITGVETEGGRPPGVDVSIWEVDSPVGRLGLVNTDAGLLRLCYLIGGEGKPADLEDLALEVKAGSSGVKVAGISLEPEPFDEVRRQLDDYFARRLRRFTLPLDWRASKGFYLKVRKAVYDIPYGQVRSYMEIASEVESKDAARAVGQAMATNPLALVGPCHRVVRSDGSRCHYGGGREAKGYLLNLERGFAD